MTGNQTPFQKGFGKDFDGPLIPFGAEVDYKPDEDQEWKCHKFGKKMQIIIHFIEK